MSKKSLEWKKIRWAGNIFHHLLRAGEPRCLLARLRLLRGQKIQHTFLETLTKKNSLRNLARFYGGLFQYEILEIFTKGLLLKIIIWTWFFFKYCRVLSLKTKKYVFKKDASHLKIPLHSKRHKKNIEKRERKIKDEKKSINNNKYFFNFIFFVRK